MSHEKVLVDMTQSVFVILISKILTSVTTLRAGIEGDVVAGEGHASADAVVVICRLDMHPFSQLGFDLTKRIHASPVLDSFSASIPLVALLFFVMPPKCFMTFLTLAVACEAGVLKHLLIGYCSN